MALPTGFATFVSTIVGSMTDTLGTVAETVVNTFPLNLALGAALIGMGVGLYKRLKH